MREAQPNPTHIYIAALQLLGLIPKLITQNVSFITLPLAFPRCTEGELCFQVDNLHPKAASLLLSSHLSPPTPPRILELHGTLAKVHCLAHRHHQERDDYQEQLAGMNPVWDEEAKEAERTGRWVCLPNRNRLCDLADRR